MASRNRRAEQEVTLDQRAASAGLEEISAAPSPTGNAAREVYDCQHKFVKRVELVRREGEDPTGDADADVVYDHVGTTRKFLKEKLGRNSLDGLGLDLILNVHYGVKFMNAFWNGEEMIFGDGDGVLFVGLGKSLDVVAHELGHGVTQFTAGLEYHGETGALNEHFSDVLGTVITQAFHGETADTADWFIGDEIMGPDLQGEALRSMRAPGTAYDNRLMGTDPQPAHMNAYYHGSLDNHGVHINSGIPNRAFYLVATELGDTLAAGRIWYEALNRTLSGRWLMGRV
jgi:Zn-dependent metalloprotease